MTNLSDTMRDLLLKSGFSANDEIVATAFKAKAEELGPDASIEDLKEALESVLMELVAEGESESDEEDVDDDDEPVDLSDEDKEYLTIASTVVKEFLDGNSWHYNTSKFRDLVVYEFRFSLEGIVLRIKIYVEANPKVFRIEAVLPISADATYEYPLCSLLAKLNLLKRFGTFKYDEDDGELTYEYSFLACHHGKLKNDLINDLETYFYAIVVSAVSDYADIRKCCAGRFNSKEVNEIQKKVADLVRDLEER